MRRCLVQAKATIVRSLLLVPGFNGRQAFRPMSVNRDSWVAIVMTPMALLAA